MPTDKSEKILAALDDMKGINIRSLDVSGLTTVTDIMIITSGRSNRHVRALADKVMETARDAGIKVIGIEGQEQGEWVLIDLGEIVVHVMQESTRDYYQLEKLWSHSSPGTQVRNR